MQIVKINQMEAEHHELVAQVFALDAVKNGLVNDYRSFCFGAYEGDTLVGLVCGNTLFDEVHIADLVVVKEHRGKGVGLQLVRTVEKQFSSRGFRCITLTTLGYQAPKFYEKLGYTLEFVRRHGSDDRLDKYFYCKRLKEREV